MARDIDWESKLSRDDLIYIAQRPWLVGEAKQYGVEDITDQLNALHTEDLDQFQSDTEHADPDEVPGTAPQGSDGLPPAPLGDPEKGPQPGDGGEPSEDELEDNYDDESEWSYEDIKAEVKDRRDAGAEGAPALNSSRETLVEWLREDDAREDVEDEEV